MSLRGAIDRFLLVLLEQIPQPVWLRGIRCDCYRWWTPSDHHHVVVLEYPPFCRGYRDRLWLRWGIIYHQRVAVGDSRGRHRRALPFGRRLGRHHHRQEPRRHHRRQRGLLGRPGRRPRRPRRRSRRRACYRLRSRSDSHRHWCRRSRSRPRRSRWAGCRPGGRKQARVTS